MTDWVSVIKQATEEAIQEIDWPGANMDLVAVECWRYTSEANGDLIAIYIVDLPVEGQVIRWDIQVEVCEQQTGDWSWKDRVWGVLERIKKNSALDSRVSGS